MEVASEAKNKIEEALTEALAFLRQIFYTYVSLLIRPVKFFSTSSERKLKPAVFAFISCFLFSLLIGHFSIFIPGLADQDISYFLEQPASFIENIQSAIQDFSFIGSLLRCLLYLFIIYATGIIASKMFISSTERNFCYEFCVYYSSWHFMTVFIILVITCLYFLQFPFSNSLKDVPLGGLFEAIIEFVWIMGLLLPIILLPVIAMIRIRRKTPNRKFYFRMITISILAFIPFLISVTIGNHLNEIKSRQAKVERLYFYHKNHKNNFYIQSYDKDSSTIKVNLVVVNLRGEKLLIDPMYAGKLDIEATSMDDFFYLNDTLQRDGTTDTAMKNFTFRYHFIVDHTTQSGNFISIDSNSQQMLSLKVIVSKRDLQVLNRLSEDMRVSAVLNVYGCNIDYESEKKGTRSSNVISEINDSPIRISQLRFSDSSAITLDTIKQKSNLPIKRI